MQSREKFPLNLHDFQAHCAIIEERDSEIQALLPEGNRCKRLEEDLKMLYERFPNPQQRPPLFGLMLGVKDVIRVDGFPTHAGSSLPETLFAGPEASCITALKQAGVLILGKTRCTEFAANQPGPTRNPWNTAHTPGGSSSGSAAAVSAGFCQIALGTQTVGSVIRPAAYCGVFGYKASYRRIAHDGVVAAVEPFDTLGVLAGRLDQLRQVAALLCHSWQDVSTLTQPVLGVIEGPYLTQVTPDALEAFEKQVVRLAQAGYRIQRLRALEDIEQINRRHMQLVFAELARIHAQWFDQYPSLYGPITSQGIRSGQSVSQQERTNVLDQRAVLRANIEGLMLQHGIDLWISPAATETAPEGIASTGSTVMNIPWSQAGLPVLSLPAGTLHGLPLGLQVAGAYSADEQLLAWAAPIAKIVA